LQLFGIAEAAQRRLDTLSKGMRQKVVPCIVSYGLGVPGHQAVSALALTPLCLPCVRRDAWLQGMSLIALAFAAHCAVVITLSQVDAYGVGAILPDATAYWHKRLLWVTTGDDPEYHWANWVPAHVRLLSGTTLSSYTSLDALTFYEGFYEVDLMNFYTAQLLRQSHSQPLALATGWHIWSLLRGLGYLCITFEVTSLALQHLLRTPLSPWSRRRRRWGLGLALILADCLAKAVLLEPVRSTLYTNLL
jgi:hypothetical protein